MTVTLSVVISLGHGSGAATVSSFQLVIPPAGGGADELTEDVGDIQAVGPEGWGTTPGPAFRFTPPGGSVQVMPDSSVMLQLTSVAVNATPGPLTIRVNVWTQGATDVTELDCLLTKAPAGFKVSPLSANPIITSGYPGSTTLSWRGSDDPAYSPSYSLEWAQNGQAVTRTGLPAVEAGYPVDGLTGDTTFTMVVDYVVDGTAGQVTRQVTVSVPVPAPSAKLTLTSEWFAPSAGGTSQVLAWDVDHASTVSIEPDIGLVDKLKSSRVVQPTARTTYTLTANILPGYSGPPALASATAQPYELEKSPGSMGGEVAVTPDGKTLYVMSYWVTVFDVATRARTAFLSLVNGLPLPTMAPDGSRIYMVGLNLNTIETLILPGNNWGPSVALGFQVNTLNQGIALTPDGTKLAVAQFRGQRVQVVDVSSPQPVLGPSAAVAVDSVGASPDGQWIYAMSSEAGVTRLAAGDLSVVARNPALAGRTMAALGVSPDGLTIVVTQDEKILLLHALTLEVQQQTTLADVSVVKLVSTGRWIFAVSIGQGVVVLDGTSLATVASFPIEMSSDDPVPNLATGPGGTSVFWTVGTTGSGGNSTLMFLSFPSEPGSQSKPGLVTEAQSGLGPDRGQGRIPPGKPGGCASTPGV